MRATFVRAAAIVATAGAVAAFVVGRRSLVWLPLSLLVWVFIEWRGAWLMHGARRGLLAGVASLFLPLSVLRPCCGIDMDMSSGQCCTMPQACVAVGALLGLSLALLVPHAPSEHRVTTAIGMALGVGSVAALRCGPLLLGESAGLIGGLVTGVVAASLARAWIDRGRTGAREG